MSEANSLPEILKTKQKVGISNMDIESEVLEPITKTQQRVNFVLPKKGILDSTTRLTLRVLSPDATAGFFPIHTGVFSAIQSCTLRIGTRIISQMDDLAHYITHTRMTHTAEQRTNFDMVQNGILDTLGHSKANPGLLCVENAIYEADGTAGVVPAKIRPTNDKTTSPVFSVALDDLFAGILRGAQLPLYLIEEPVSVEINFTQQTNTAGDVGKVLCFDASYSGNKAVSIDLDSVKLLCDYLMYNDQTMEQTRRAVYSQNGMILPYTDVSVTNTNIPAAASQPATGTLPSRLTVTRDIGTAGKTVEGVLVVSKKSANNVLVGQYKSDAYIHPERWNLRVNDEQLYPRDVSQIPRMVSETEKVLGDKLHIHQAVYSRMLDSDLLQNVDGATNDILDSETLEGHAQSSLEGVRHVVGIPTTITPNGRGTQVGIKNARYELSVQHCRNDYEARELKFFVKYARMFVLKDGVITVST